MKIAYFSRPYRPSLTQGGNAHIKQFLDIVSANGHEIWVSMPDEHPASKVLPAGRFSRLLALRSMDVIYCRIEWQPRTQCRLAVNPYRFLSGRAKHVWEFNTVPEYGLLNEASQNDVDQSIFLLRQWGQGCDLAVCVSEAIEGYVQKHFKISRTVVAPNGSDPDLFRPDVPSVPQMEAFADKFNVAWIGSADIIWHDLDRIIAAADLLADVSQIHFHLIGSGTEKYDNHTPQAHGHGAVQYMDLPGWLAAMQLGLVFYKPGAGDYSSPLKSFDFFSAGLAVLTDQPQVSAILSKMGQPEMIMPDRSPQALAEKIYELSRQPMKTAERGKIGRETLTNNYTWEKSIKKVLSHINGLWG